MRIRRLPILFFLFAPILGLVGVSQSQSSGEKKRKVLRKADLIYPDMARRTNLAGTVKVFAIVSPDGTVKTLEAVGGSPLLVQASEDAIKQWKFAPAAAESKELIELHFHTQ
jgi:outer membrane biosynthesis protein TonB